MTFTKHARERMEERRITEDEIEMAVFYGERFPKDGVYAYVLSSNCGDYPTPLPACLRGLVVIIDPDMRVVTTFRCPKRDLRVRYAA